MGSKTRSSRLISPTDQWLALMCDPNEITHYWAESAEVKDDGKNGSHFAVAGKLARRKWTRLPLLWCNQIPNSKKRQLISTPATRRRVNDNGQLLCGIGSRKGTIFH